MSSFWSTILSNAVLATLIALVAKSLSVLWKHPAAVHVLWLAVLVKLFTPALISIGIPLASDEPPPLRNADSAIGQLALVSVGNLSKGNYFFMVGDQQVGSVREFIERIVAEADTQNRDISSIRVVYAFRSLEMEGTNTQYLQLGKADIQELKAALVRSPKGSE